MMSYDPKGLMYLMKMQIGMELIKARVEHQKREEIAEKQRLLAESYRQDFAKFQRDFFESPGTLTLPPGMRVCEGNQSGLRRTEPWCSQQVARDLRWGQSRSFISQMNQECELQGLHADTPIVIYDDPPDEVIRGFGERYGVFPIGSELECSNEIIFLTKENQLNDAKCETSSPSEHSEPGVGDTVKVYDGKNLEGKEYQVGLVDGNEITVLGVDGDMVVHRRQITLVKKRDLTDVEKLILKDNGRVIRDLSEELRSVYRRLENDNEKVRCDVRYAQKNILEEIRTNRRASFRNFVLLIAYTGFVTWVTIMTLRH